MSAQPGTRRPVPDTIDFVYDHGVEGDVATHDEVKASDFTEVIGEHRTETDEVMEVTRVEMIPPKADDGSLESFEYLRLWSGDSYYPKLRFREFMMGYKSGDYPLTTPSFGTAVLSGDANPDANVFQSAVPKFGTDTPVSPAVQNNDTAITDSFRIRLHVWRWDGTDSELQEWFNSAYGSTSYNQNISVSNPYKGTRRTYSRGGSVSITPGADGGAKGQFTQLTGGVDQSLPRVYPWATWTTNNQATKANRQYRFTTSNDRVDEDWKRLEFDYTDRKRAVLFDTIQVNTPDNLSEGAFVLDSRPDPQPGVQLTPNSAHQLPLTRPLDGSEPGHDDLPVEVADVAGEPQVIWDDGGGFRITDDGTSIPAEEVLIGVTGYQMVLTS